MMASAHAGAEKTLAGDVQSGNEGYSRPSSRSMHTTDPESGFDGEAHLLNTSVHNLTWKGVTVTVKDRQTKNLRNIVDDVEGMVEAGRFLGIEPLHNEVSTLSLSLRRNMCPDGSLWVWQDDTPECPCSA